MILISSMIGSGLESGDPYVHQVSGHIIQPINPSLSTQEPGNSFYLFESSVLVAVGATLFERLESGIGNLLPEIRRTDRFPYREETGIILETCPYDLIANNLHRKSMFSVQE